MTICFGTCVGYPEKLAAHAMPGLEASVKEAYDHWLPESNGTDIFPIYAEILRLARSSKSEALVLMHDDLEFRDPELSSKIREVFKDPSVAIIGLIGARGAKALEWWKGDRRGAVEDAASGRHDHGFDGGASCPVDTIDGMCVILSPWALENLTLEGLGYVGFHGYADELCAQARSLGKRVVVADIKAFHHSKGGITGDPAAWKAANETFRSRWFPKEDADPWAPVKKPAPWDVEAMFTAKRGEPVSTLPYVMLATPAYNPPCLEFLHARERVTNDLASSGYGVTVVTSPGDSLVMRGRHSLMHEFLKSPCTHLVFWDVDIEPKDPSIVREMLETQHHIVGGACPFRGETGRVVCNIRQVDKDRAQIDTDDRGCAEVSEVGTGFLLMSREAIVKLCEAYPELMYFADLPGGYGEPHWALFDTALVERRFLSEDYFFCKLWRDLGGRVHVYVPFEARHWGRKGYEASFRGALGMRTP